MLIRTLVLLAFAMTSAAHAENFDVQIGAFQNPDVARIQLPAGVGELRSTSGPDGLTRFVVGPFASRVDAEQARDRLRSAGFDGAFVRASHEGRAQAVTTERVSQPAPTYRANAATSSQRELDRYMQLSDEERRDVVFLDGRLHRKVGDQFIPLEN